MVKDTSIIDKMDRSDEIIPFKYSITSYGADYPVDSLVKRLNEESIFIPPFQRKYIWDKNVAFKGRASLCLSKTAKGFFPFAQWCKMFGHDGSLRRTMVTISARTETVKQNRRAPAGASATFPPSHSSRRRIWP